MSTLAQILIGAVCFYLIFTFLLPLLTGILHTIATIVVVVAGIVWLLQLAGVTFPWHR